MGEFPPVLDLNKLKIEMNLSDNAIRSSGFTEADLQEIYTDYTVRRWEELTALKNDFVSRHIVAANGIRLHSYNGRVKDPYHLIEKIVRKRSTNYSKYQNMTAADYYKYITDLIGCRILLVYKEDWEGIHQYLTRLFPDDPANYIDDSRYAACYDAAPPPPFMAEPPVAHIRLGDENIYHDKLNVKSDRYYRSLHYIVRYEAYYVEIQLRTLFEEAWGEVDHDVLYPYYKNDLLLVDFSKLINRAAGMGDEMSTFFKNKLSLGRSHQPDNLIDVPITTTRPGAPPPHISASCVPAPCISGPCVSGSPPPSMSDGATAQDVMNTLLNRDEV